MNARYLTSTSLTPPGSEGGYGDLVLDPVTGALRVSMVGGSGGGGGAVTGPDATGSTPTGNPVLVAGTDGSVVKTLRTDNFGNLTTVVTGASFILSGSTDSGSSLKVGMKVVTSKSGMANNVRTDMLSDPFGNLFVRPVTTILSGFNGLGAAWAAQGANDNTAYAGAPAGSLGFLYNGTTIDAVRSATSAAGTTGTGLAGAGILGFDGTNYRPVSVDTSGRTIVRPLGGAVATGDGVANAYRTLLDDSGGPVILGTTPRVYNGTSLDALRGDATGGVYVQERERTSYFAETLGSIAASATVFSTTRDAGANPINQWGAFRVIGRVDTGGGTLAIQGSDDGTNWSVNLAQIALSSGTAFSVSAPIYYRYYRAVIVKDSTAGTIALFRTQFAAQ